jgi:hypothetical protein
MARKKKNNKFTTISIKWDDKDLFRRFAKKVKNTQGGERYESDSSLFGRILEEFKMLHQEEISSHPNSTYPSQDKSQQDSDSSESN